MEEKSLMLQNCKLPTIQEIYSETSPDSIKQNQLNILLNQPPLPEWIKKHPLVKKKVNGVFVPIEYLPIERVEYLLTRLFIKWSFEIKEVKLVANSVVVIGRLHYQNQITGQWEYQDGVGATPLQLDEGSNAIDFTKIKSNAVMIAAPAAKSYAIKDAAECIGKIFGKDLNRADQIGYDNLSYTFAETDPKRLYAEKLLFDSTLTDKTKDAIASEIKTCDYERLKVIISTLSEKQDKVITDGEENI
jgi:hypothetical protein